MFDVESGELRVIVPVGFLLTEEQEVSVSVERPDGGGSLPIRLRLVPARMASIGPDQQTPVTYGWPASRLTVAHDGYDDDGYPAPEYGGGD